MTRRAVTRWACALACLAAACSPPTASCPGTPGLQGTWTYEATREAPLPAMVSGTLVVSSQSCTDFQGALDVVEVSASGERQRVSGPVSGSLLDATVARFEVTLAGVTREHLGRLAGDSLSGSWVESAGEAPGSGRFGGQRR